MEPSSRTTRAALRFAVVAVIVSFIALHAGRAQTVNTMPSRQTIEEASHDSCDGVSVIVQRCAGVQAADAAKKPADDRLTRSRAGAKAAFDRRDRRARAAALDAADAPPASSTASPVVSGAAGGDAQRLGGVTVTGTAEPDAPTVGEIFQRAFNPGTGEVPGPNGTVSRYGPDGVRFDCIAKCVGPACCATVRSLPNPARDSNSIGR